MKTVVISKNFEIVNIPFGDGTAFTAKANVKHDNLFACLNIIQANEKQALAIRELTDEAEAERKTAALMSELVIQLFGVQKYNELVEAIGGEGASPTDVNFSMAVLWVELVEFVKERVARFANTRAAHYLVESLNNGQADQ